MVEGNGSQHVESYYLTRESQKNVKLSSKIILELKPDGGQILEMIEGTTEVILKTLYESLQRNISSQPPHSLRWERLSPLCISYANIMDVMIFIKQRYQEKPNG